jgi:hypothetical protein
MFKELIQQRASLGEDFKIDEESAANICVQRRRLYDIVGILLAWGGCIQQTAKARVRLAEGSDLCMQIPKENQLRIATRLFKAMLIKRKQQGMPAIDALAASIALGVPRRRVYELQNVLYGWGLLTRRANGCYEIGELPEDATHVVQDARDQTTSPPPVPFTENALSPNALSPILTVGNHAALISPSQFDVPIANLLNADECNLLLVDDPAELHSPPDGLELPTPPKGQYCFEHIDSLCASDGVPDRNATLPSQFEQGTRVYWDAPVLVSHMVDAHLEVNTTEEDIAADDLGLGFRHA